MLDQLKKRTAVIGLAGMTACANIDPEEVSRPLTSQEAIIAGKLQEELLLDTPLVSGAWDQADHSIYKAKDAAEIGEFILKVPQAFMWYLEHDRIRAGDAYLKDNDIAGAAAGSQTQRGADNYILLRSENLTDSGVLDFDNAGTAFHELGHQKFGPHETSPNIPDTVNLTGWFAEDIYFLRRQITLQGHLADQYAYGNEGGWNNNFNDTEISQLMSMSQDQWLAFAVDWLTGNPATAEFRKSILADERYVTSTVSNLDERFGVSQDIIVQLAKDNAAALYEKTQENLEAIVELRGENTEPYRERRELRR